MDNFFGKRSVRAARAKVAAAAAREAREAKAQAMEAKAQAEAEVAAIRRTAEVTASSPFDYARQASRDAVLEAEAKVAAQNFANSFILFHHNIPPCAWECYEP